MMKRILFIDNSPYDIFHPEVGCAQRSNLLLQACAKYGNVDLIRFHENGTASNIENCTVICEQSIDDSDFLRKINLFHWFFLGISKESFSPVNRKKVRAINNVLKQKSYDLIVIRYLGDAVNCGLLRYSDKLMIDIDDNPLDWLKSYVSQQIFIGKTGLWNRIKLKRKCHLMTKAYPRIIEKLNYIFTSNPEDCTIGKIKFLPNISFYSHDVSVCKFRDTPKQILFVGFISYWPNYQGINHFFDAIYPLIIQEDKDIKFIFIGKYDNTDISKWEKLPGVRFKGFVEDLSDEYASSRVAIVPIYHGAGTNIKILEAMEFCRPVVTTEFGTRGYRNYYNNGSDFLVSKDDYDFAQNVVSLVNDETMNNSIANNAKQKVNDLYSKENFFRIVGEVLEQA